jgi:hypothetical protein
MKGSALNAIRRKDYVRSGITGGEKRPRRGIE